MKRCLPIFLLLALTGPALGQEEAAPASAGRDPQEEAAAAERDLGQLEHLTGIPLPRELSAPPAAIVDLAASGLLGRPVMRVTAIDAPAGFDPVDDAEVPLGIPLAPAVIRGATERLWATGRYRDIRIFARPAAGGGAELLVAVQPMLRIHVFTVKGNRALDTADVKRAVGFTPDRTILPEPEVLRELREGLLAAYAERGYREADATLRIETTDEPGEVALFVEVTEGRPERYTTIALSGLPAELPAGAIAAEVGLGPRTVRDQTIVEKAVEQLGEVLAGRGYRDARIGEFREQRLGERSYALTIPIEPGVATQIRFDGNRYLTTSELRAALIEGLVFRTTPLAVEQGSRRLRDHYREQGFFHVRIEAGRLCFDDRGYASFAPGSRSCGPSAVSQQLVFKIAEGPPVEVADVLFEGNEHISEDELREELLGFMVERNSRDEVFQRINTATADAAGLSDPRPGRIGKPRGARAPSVEPERAYVPGHYLAAMEHLTGIYQERGFLQAQVTDACWVEKRAPIKRLGMKFYPLQVTRAATEDAETAVGTSPCVLINEDLDQLLVVIRVQEGPQTRLSQIDFEGNEQLASAQLLSASGLAAGQPYNELRLREAARDLRSIYGARGYMFADVTWKKSFSPNMQRADVAFALREGDQVRVGAILVRGNETTARSLIIERLTLEPGDLITPEELSESEQRVMELGVFDGATVQLVAPETPAKVKNVVVQVAESKPQYLELRGGLATVEGLRAGFEYGYRNIGGWAINARGRARANYRLLFVNEDLQSFEERYYDMPVGDRLERHLLLGIGTEHFPGTHGYLGLGIDGINERLNEPAFSADRTSGYFRVKSRFLRFKVLGRRFELRIELRTGVERSNIELPTNIENLQQNPQFQKWARIPAGASTFWVSGATLELDGRDDIFNPSRGVFLSVGADLVRSLTNFNPETTVTATGETVVVDKLSNLIRAQATLSGYVPLLGTEMVLAMSATAGYIFHLQPDSNTWADRYFYMGGVSTLRGFAEESLIPEDVYQDWKSQLQRYGDEADALLETPGGEAMLLVRSELRYPLAQGFYGAGFLEAGNLWRFQQNIDPLRLRPVTGVGLRYLTPLGPLALDLGVNLDRRPHEARFAWFFSIGSAF